MDLSPKKSLGQHFLKNPHVVTKIIASAHLKNGDIVLEIGPGTGALTEGLLNVGARVIAIEADARMVKTLTQRFASAIDAGTLTVHHADVRDQALTAFVPADLPYSIISNIPYYLSGMLLRTALESAHQPQRIVFLVQKEVAERIARSKKESLLSLAVKVYGTPRYVGTVPRGNFTPPPKVDSAILLIEDISRARFHILTEAWFFRIVHAGFSSRRKQLLVNLSVILPKEILLHACETLSILPTIRGEDLSIDQWCALSTILWTTTHLPAPS